MTQTRISIEGLREMNDALKELEGKAASQATRAGIAKAAQVVRKEMRNRAPVAEGELRRNLIYRIRKLGQTGFAGKVGPTKDVFYARFIEFGTSGYEIRPQYYQQVKGKRRGGNFKKALKFDDQLYGAVQRHPQPPRPFLRPAVDACLQAALDAAGQQIWKRIEKVKARQ